MTESLEPIKEPRRAPSKRIPKRAYASFIGQLEIQQVWLTSLVFTNHSAANKPENADVSLSYSNRWDFGDEEFVARTRYEVAFAVPGDEEPVLHFDVVYSATFASSERPPDNYMDQFCASSLQLILWPHLRQLVHDHLGRANWGPFSIPTFKVGLI